MEVLDRLKLVVALVVACAHPTVVSPRVEPGAIGGHATVTETDIDGGRRQDRPLPALRVVTHGPDHELIETISDASGFYSLQVLAPGPYPVRFCAGDVFVQVRAIEVRAGSVTPVFFTMDRQELQVRIAQNVPCLPRPVAPRYY